MSKILTIILICFLVTSCKEYNKGVPVIVKRQQSLIPGKCIYTYEGFGREEMFDDDCGKYQVGDTLKGQ